MEQNETQNIMSKPLTILQALVALVMMLITIGGIVYTRGTTDNRTVNRVEFLERQFVDFKEEQKSQNKETSEKIDKVDGKLNEILIILQNKQDRK